MSSMSHIAEHVSLYRVLAQTFPQKIRVWEELCAHKMDLERKMHAACTEAIQAELLTLIGIDDKEHTTPTLRHATKQLERALKFVPHSNRANLQRALESGKIQGGETSIVAHTLSGYAIDLEGFLEAAREQIALYHEHLVQAADVLSGKNKVYSANVQTKYQGYINVLASWEDNDSYTALGQSITRAVTSAAAFATAHQQEIKDNAHSSIILGALIGAGMLASLALVSIKNPELASQPSMTNVNLLIGIFSGLTAAASVAIVTRKLKNLKAFQRLAGHLATDL